LVVGAILGGLIAGILCGPSVTLYYGRFNRSFLDPFTAAPGAVIATAIIAFSIVNYSLEQFSGRRILSSFLSAFMATVVTFVLLILCLAVLDSVGFIRSMFTYSNQGWYDHFETDIVKASFRLMSGGLAFGMVFGPFLGLLIGLTYIWSPKSMNDYKSIAKK